MRHRFKTKTTGRWLDMSTAAITLYHKLLLANRADGIMSFYKFLRVVVRCQGLTVFTG